FTAKPEGATLVIMNRDGTAYTPKLSIQSASGYVVDTGSKAILGAFDTTPVAGDTWSLTVRAGATLTFDVAIGQLYSGVLADTQGNIARIFAKLINDSSLSALTALAK